MRRARRAESPSMGRGVKTPAAARRGGLSISRRGGKLGLGGAAISEVGSIEAVAGTDEPDYKPLCDGGCGEVPGLIRRHATRVVPLRAAGGSAVARVADPGVPRDGGDQTTRLRSLYSNRD